MRNWILAAALSCTLASCASMPTATEQASADYGQPIDQAAAEQQAKAYLSTRLKDPMSAVYAWEPVAKGFVGKAPLAGRKEATYGYLLNGSVNSKNSFGGYTGAKPYQFVFRDGRLVYAMHQECLDAGACYMAPL